jgi:protein-tyrosine phosphatase
MNQIKPHPIWVGHAGDGRSFQEIFEKGIRAVVHLAAEEPPGRLPRELIYCRYPLIDGSGNDAALLQLAINSLAALLKKEIPTLVCCGAGMSRAPAIAAAALATLGEGAVEECMEAVAHHHKTDVSPALWREVQRVVVSGA